MKRVAVFVFCAGFGIVAQAQQVPIEFGSAIDAHGTKHIGRGPGGPSGRDFIFAPRPEYPYSERVHHNEGTAVVRMDIDLKTGNTTSVTLIRSSGYPKLDDAAIRTLARWRCKPGKWKEAEVPVTFTMSLPR
jgi:TonB family protein